MSYMDVLFSAPYSGALYGWFMQRKEEFSPDLPPYPMEAPYFRHALRGAARARTTALAALVMFDRVYLAAGDLAAPSQMRSSLNDGMPRRRDFSGHLGITVGQNLMHYAGIHVGVDNIPDIAKAPGMPTALRSIPQDEYWNEIVGAVADAMLVGILGVPLICGPRRRKVIQALINLGIIDRAMIFGHPSPTAGWATDGVEEGEKIILSLESYQELSALKLRNETLHSVGEVKNDTAVRACAESFQALLSEQSTSVSQDHLRELALTASRRVRLAGRIDKVISFFTGTLGFASLAPSAGPLLGPVSASDALMHGPTQVVAQRNSWYEFASRASSAAIQSRILGP